MSNIPLEIFEKLEKERTECVRNATEKATQQFFKCQQKHKHSTQAAVDCINKAAEVRRLEEDLCNANFRAAVGFNVQPDVEQPSPPPPEVLLVKRGAKELAAKFMRIGAAVAVTGMAWRSMSKLISAEAIGVGGARAKEILDGIGLATAGVGTALGGVAAYKRFVDIDPPDFQFRDIALARHLGISEVFSQLDAETLSTTPFAPMVTHYLQAFSYIEAFLVSLERSLGALEAGDVEKHLAHIRVTREYSAAYAKSLRQASAARTLAASSLVGLSIQESAEDEPVVVTISIQEVMAVHNDLKSGIIDETFSTIVDSLSSERIPHSHWMEAISNFVPSAIHFDPTPSALLFDEELSIGEADSAAAFEEYARSNAF